MIAADDSNDSNPKVTVGIHLIVVGFLLLVLIFFSVIVMNVPVATPPPSRKDPAYVALGGIGIGGDVILLLFIVILYGRRRDGRAGHAMRAARWLCFFLAVPPIAQVAYAWSMSRAPMSLDMWDMLDMLFGHVNLGFFGAVTLTVVGASGLRAP